MAYTAKSAAALRREGGSLLDCGSAAEGTAHGDNLIDGLAIDAAGIADNLGAGAGTNGLSVVELAANGGAADFVTGQILIEEGAALAGSVYIYYTAV